MNRIFRVPALTLLALLAVSYCLGFGRSAADVSGQTEMSGEWTAEFNPKYPDQIQISIIRHSDKGYNMMGESFRISEIQGLDPSISTASQADVTFALAREAGTISFKGSFKQGRGAGFWTFSSNPSFVSAMQSRGFSGISDEDLLRATTHNVTAKYADDMKSAGLQLDFQQLIRGAGHDVTLAYIREMQQAGYPGLTMEELVRGRNHEINARYIQEIKAMGFEKQPLESLIRLKNRDIDPEFIAQMRSAGFEELSPDQIVRLKNHEVTIDFVNELKGEGFTDVSPESAIRARNHEIDRAFIQKARAQGYNPTSIEELIRLRNRGMVK